MALDVGIVSCPYSNMLFARSVVPITEYYHLNNVSDGGILHGENEAINMKKIAFGTDISGGPSSSLWVNMRLAILQDRIKSYRSMADYPPTLSPPPPIPAPSTSAPPPPPQQQEVEQDSGSDETSWTMTHTYAYHIATVGGAETVGMGELLGRWEVGRLFDGFLVDWVVEERGEGGEAGFDGWVGKEEEENEKEEEWIRDGWERFVMGGDDR